MAIDSANPVIVPQQPERVYPRLWLHGVSIDGSRRVDVVPALLTLANYAQATPSDPRDFAPVEPRRIRVRDLFALAAKEPLVAQAVAAVLAAARRVDEMHAQRQALLSELPALVNDAATKRQAATASRQASEAARYAAGTVSRLDAELAGLAAEQARRMALPEDDPERAGLPAIEQRVSEANAEREAAAATALEDEAAAVAAEAAATEAESAATTADAAVSTMQGRINALEL